MTRPTNDQRITHPTIVAQTESQLSQFSDIQVVCRQRTPAEGPYQPNSAINRHRTGPRTTLFDRCDNCLGGPAGPSDIRELHSRAEHSISGEMWWVLLGSARSIFTLLKGRPARRDGSKLTVQSLVGAGVFARATPC